MLDSRHDVKTASIIPNRRPAAFLGATLGVALLFAASYLWIAVDVPVGLWGTGGIELAGGLPGSDHDEYGNNVVRDGFGNLIYTFFDSTDGVMRAQKVNGSGQKLWGAQGVSIGTATFNGLSFDAVDDGAGGVFVVWYYTDVFLPVSAPYAQRVDADGNLVFPTGHFLATASPCNLGTDFQTMGKHETVISDGAGGFIATWTHQDGNAVWDTCVARLDGDGNRLWGDGGVNLDDDSGANSWSSIASDDAGGAFVAFNKANTLRVFNLDADGNIDAGCPAAGDTGKTAFIQNAPVLAKDGSGGVVVSVYSAQRAYRIDPDCALDANWPVSGVVLTGSPIGATYDQLGNVMVTTISGCCGSTVSRAELFAVADGASVWGGSVLVSDSGNDVANPFPAEAGGNLYVWFTDDDNVHVQLLDSSDGSPDPDFGSTGLDTGIDQLTSVNTFNLTARPIVGDGDDAVIAVTASDGVGGGIFGDRVNLDGSFLWGATVIGGAPPSNPGQFGPQVVSDEDNHIIVIWQDDRNGNLDLYFQKYDGPDGSRFLEPEGRPVVEATGDQYFKTHSVVSDGAFIYFCWEDMRSGEHDVYALKTDKDGNPQWTANGVDVTDLPGNQFTPNCAPDGTGGMVVIWHDENNNVVRMNKIDSSGNLPWGPSGVDVGALGNFRFISGDGVGGAFGGWVSYSGDVILTHLDTDGNIYSAFQSGGLNLSSNGAVSGNAIGMAPLAIAGGTNTLSTLVAWREGDSMYAARVNEDGGNVWMTTVKSGDVQDFIYEDFEGQTRIVSTVNDDYPIVSWKDQREGGNSLFAQRLDLDTGDPIWDSEGIQLSGGGGGQASASWSIAGDGNGGMGAVMSDGDEIYGAMLDSDGNHLAGSPFVVSAEVGNQFDPQIADVGSFVMVWTDERNDAAGDIFGQHYEAQPPATMFVEVSVINDDGGDAIPSDFALHAYLGATREQSLVQNDEDGFGTFSGLAPGDYTVQTGIPFGTSYSVSFGGDCDGGGNVSLGPAEERSCTVVFDDAAPTPGYVIETQTGQAIIPGVTDIGLNCDDCTTGVSLPFPVNFYGAEYTDIVVSSNGNIQFNTDTGTLGASCLPTGNLESAILLFQGDLHTAQNPGEGVFTAVVGSAPDRDFIIEWRTSYFGSPGDSANFEAIFHENSDTITTIYGNSADGGANEVIGVQASSAGPSTEFSCFSGSATSGLQVEYVPFAGGAGDPELIIHIPFDEGVGTFAADITGNGHHATLDHAGWTSPGRLGAAAFVGDGSNVAELADTLGLDLLNERTVSAWVRTSTPAPFGVQTGIVSKIHCGVGDAWYLWQVDPDFDNRAVWEVPGGNDNVVTPEPITDGLWRHIVGTDNGAVIKIYVDGVLWGSAPIISFATPSDVPITIGKLFGEPLCSDPSGFVGNIDDVRIYDKWLTGAEVAALYASAFPSGPPPSPGGSPIRGTPVPPPICGNALCENGESFSTCASDCPFSEVPLAPPPVPGTPPSLMLAKSALRADPTPTALNSVRLFGTVRYRITVTNVGGSTAYRTVIRDPLPPQIDYLQNSVRLNGTAQTDAADGDTTTYNPVARELRLSLPPIPPGESRVFTFDAKLVRRTDGSIIRNKVFANYSDVP